MSTINAKPLTARTLDIGRLSITVPNDVCFADLKLVRVADAGQPVVYVEPIMRVLKASGIERWKLSDAEVSYALSAVMVAMHRCALERGEDISVDQAQMLRDVVAEEFADLYPCYSADAPIADLVGSTVVAEDVESRCETMRDQPASVIETVVLTVPDDVRFSDLHFRCMPSGDIAFDVGPVQRICTASGLDAEALRSNPATDWEPFLVAVYEWARVRKEALDAEQLELFYLLVKTDQIGPMKGVPEQLDRHASPTVH